MPSSYPPVWVINLPRSTERRAYIVAHLQELGLPFEIVPAVDGQMLTQDELTEFYSLEQTLACIGRELVPGEIGCSLSHLRLYERMVTEGVEMALILEDDAVIDPEVLELLAKPEAFPPGWELLLLYHSEGQMSWWHRRPLTGRFRTGRFVQPTYGTAGYLITQGGARKILAQAYPVRAPSDHWTGGHMNTGVQLYGLEPCGIAQRYVPEDPLHSTITGRGQLRSALGWDIPFQGVHLLRHLVTSRLCGWYCRYHPRRIL